jgi:hypothetical protein
MKNGIGCIFLAAMIIILGSFSTVNAAENTNVKNDYKIHYNQTNAVTSTSTRANELANVSKSINMAVKKPHKSIMGLGLATIAVGSAYVGSHNWNDMQNKIGVDRVAHFGVSYIINDQLQNAGMSPFAATLTTIAIGAAKEKFIDNKWDQGDFAADCIGAMLVNVQF